MNREYDIGRRILTPENSLFEFESNNGAECTSLNDILSKDNYQTEIEPTYSIDKAWIKDEDHMNHTK